MSTAILEREIKNYPIEENPGFDSKLYMACVRFASGLKTKELERHVDLLLDEILKYPGVCREVKEQTAIFGYLSRRRKS